MSSLIENNPTDQTITEINLIYNNFSSNTAVTAGIVFRNVPGKLTIHNNYVTSSTLSNLYQSHINSLLANMNVYLDYANSNGAHNPFLKTTTTDIGIFTIYLISSNHNDIVIRDNQVIGCNGSAVRLQVTQSNHNRLALDSNIFRLNQALYNGGGISWFSSASDNNTVIIQNNNIENNTGPLAGGGLFFQNLNVNNMNIMVDNNRIFANLAQIMGGGISSVTANSNILMTIYNSSIQHCSSAIGGGISLYETNMLVKESYLQHNKAYFGGSIALLNERNNQYYFYANLTDSVISDNLGIKNNNNYGIAGAIYLKSYQLLLRRMDLFNNYGEEGGVISTRYYHSTNKIDIYSSNINGNSAQEGGIFVLKRDKLNIYDSSIYNNRAILGGVISKTQEDDSVFLQIYSVNNKYYSNTALQNGGIFYIRDNRYYITFMNDTFYHNQAESGNLGYSQTQNSFINLFSNNVTDNIGGGGGLLYITGNQFALLIQNNQITNNRGGTGVFINANGGTSQITNNNFRNNNVVNGLLYLTHHQGTLKDNHFQSNIGRKGTDLYLDYSYLISNHNIFYRSQSQDIGGSIYIERVLFYKV